MSIRNQFSAPAPKPAVSIENAREAVASVRRKQRISIYLDTDVLEAFKATGRDWQPRINAALRKALDL